MKFRLALLLILMVSLLPAVQAIAAGDRVALVIGNAKYPDAESPLNREKSERGCTQTCGDECACRYV